MTRQTYKLGRVPVGFVPMRLSNVQQQDMVLLAGPSLAYCDHKRQRSSGSMSGGRVRLGSDHGRPDITRAYSKVYHVLVTRRQGDKSPIGRKAGSLCVAPGMEPMMTILLTSAK